MANTNNATQAESILCNNTNLCYKLSDCHYILNHLHDAHFRYALREEDATSLDPRADEVPLLAFFENLGVEIDGD